MAARAEPDAQEHEHAAGAPGTNANTMSPEKARPGMTPRVWLSIISEARTRAPAAPTAGEDLGPSLLGERDAGPEAEQEVARLAVHVSERVAQAAAEEHAGGVAEPHPDDDVQRHPHHARGREGQRDPALLAAAHEQQQRRAGRAA